MGSIQQLNGQAAHPWDVDPSLPRVGTVQAEKSLLKEWRLRASCGACSRNTSVLSLPHVETQCLTQINQQGSAKSEHLTAHGPSFVPPISFVSDLS